MAEKKKNTSLLTHLAGSRRLIWNLARNDIKKKFAGSYFGVIWAFVQPVITVLLYWFVFEKGLNSKATDLRTGIEIPFVLWLMAGLVPWFYFQEAMNGGTGVLVEYSYLVKKVVFQIDTLPVVKMISALFTHLFFVVFAIAVFAFMGYYPDLYTLQVIYYSVCMLVLTTGIVYATGAITVFFRDMKEVVAILLQIGMWVTPIMWSFESMVQIPEWAKTILKLNPMYYVVSGYRDALINKIGFWENPGLTIYFWIFTIVAFALGTSVFKRLRPHFADVL
ncbi:MAG: ABC transporter permease [Clostridiales bacterium]|nr:ABC transporter permease [Roseburia sp.]MDD7637923.1 ABC transporter permease [Clostridiales bacterium]MDY4113754.1 ABC transporter permease [Roseburia sp.]